VSSSSKTESPRDLPETVVVGTVLRPHGVRGALVVEPRSDVPDRFGSGAVLELAPVRGERRSVRVVRSSPHRGGLRVELEGIDSRDRAEELRGADLEIPLSAVSVPPAGQYFHFELVGCRCFDRHEGELGTVEQVVADGGGWLLVVARRQGGRLPLPFVERYLLGVDRERRRIDWDLPEGLIEACASKS